MAAARDRCEGLGDDPAALRARVAEMTREAARASIGLWYRFGLVDGEPYPCDWVGPADLDGIFTRWVRERLSWPGGDPRVPDRRVIDRFVATSALFTADALEKTAVYQRCVAPLGVTDQVRMMVYFRGRHIGWVGAMRADREPPFAGRDLRRLRAITPTVRSALIHADALARAATPQEACDLVLDPHGRVELASSSASALLDHPERASMITSWVRDAEHGREPPRTLAGLRVHWSRLTGSCGSRYLLHLEPVEPVRLAPEFELSATQRQVAQYAAAGARLSEIATALGIAETTAKTHLRVVYAKLDVGGRAELAAAMRDMQ